MFVASVQIWVYLQQIYHLIILEIYYKILNTQSQHRCYMSEYNICL